MYWARMHMPCMYVCTYAMGARDTVQWARELSSSLLLASPVDELMVLGVCVFQVPLDLMSSGFVHRVLI